MSTNQVTYPPLDVLKPVTEDLFIVDSGPLRIMGLPLPVRMTVIRLAKLVIELEWAILNEALPPPGEINPWTATDEEIKAYAVLHPGFYHPPPSRTG